MVEVSTRLVYVQTLFNLRSVARMLHSQSCLGFAESLRKVQQRNEDNGSSASTDIKLVPEVENPNDINPGSSDASVTMYDFYSSFDDLSSDATSAVQNV